MPLETEVLLQDKNKRKDGPAHSEDLALKSAAAYFGDELIHWLGIRERALRAVPTEMVELETRHMYEDFLYEMENGMYYHFEFLDDDELKSIKEAVAMTKLGQMIWNDALEKGREEGEKIGQKRASDRYSRLILLLTKENKNDLIVKIASDPKYREELYKQYGI